ncbi:DUF2931 family protein [Enterobacter sp.]|uniref:DUF2931 family protein n=1 Tax=Enterobacter sp. TaxID=42895 RepID=UPI00296FCB35|nr:DUF2931 family protein [Enterobacter sp.]
MKYLTRLSLLSLFMLTACHAGKPMTPEETGAMPYGEWGFAFFTPKALPASVNFVTLLDEKQVHYTFRTLDSVQSNPSSVGKWFQRVSRYTQFNKARHPPLAIIFCWDSIIDKKTYETHITFSQATRDRMHAPAGVDISGDTAWYDTMLFGLAPEGKVRVWLQTLKRIDNLPVQPEKLVTLSGRELRVCKNITNHKKGYVHGYAQETKDFIKDKTYPYGEW